MLGFPISYRPKVVKAIQEELSEAAEVFWLTTWEDLANSELAPAIGLNAELPVLKAQFEPAKGKFADYVPPWWKLNVVKKFIRENPTRRFVWIDDDIEKMHKSAVHAAASAVVEYDKDREHHLIIRTDSFVGLRDDEIARILTWIHEDNA